MAASPCSGSPGSCRSWPGAVASALLPNLTNPPMVVMFAAIFASMAPPDGFAPGNAAAMVGGALAGSMLWWCGVVGGVSAIRNAIGQRARRWVDRLAGAALVAFGALEVRRSV